MRSLYLLCCGLLLGCGNSGSFDAARAPTAEPVSANDSQPSTDSITTISTEAVSTPQENAKRKIIYNANVSLVVEDLSVVEAALPELIEQYSGFLANSSVNHRSGTQRTGRWQARVPVAGYQAFLAALSKLGVPENVEQTAVDVSEEFVDLNARIANARRLESRVVQLLDDKSGKIKDVIEVERELARVRGEIEQMEGRLRFLTDRTALSTVTITVREEHDYVPPEAPTFVSRITTAMDDSWQGLLSFGKNAIVAVVFALPWATAGAVILSPAMWTYRRRRKR